MFYFVCPKLKFFFQAALSTDYNDEINLRRRVVPATVAVDRMYAQKRLNTKYGAERELTKMVRAYIICLLQFLLN